MTNKLYLFSLLLIFSCSGLKKSASSDTFNIPKDLREFLMQFEKATLEHNQQSVLSFMDVNYLKEQHDNMLSGRTDQFLTELFCGMQTNGEGFKCPGFNLITKIKLVNVKNNGDTYSVQYIVTAGEIIIKTEWQITKQKTSSGIRYGIFGALG